MYDLRAIANYFIDRGIREEKPISPMKLQKLLFFAYGLYYAAKDAKEPLFSERFEAWKWGPVIPQLYHILKGYGSQPIDRRISFLDMAKMSVVTPTVNMEDKELIKFLDKFWESFKGYSATKLSNATHLPDTPWDKALKKDESLIDDKDMREYFSTWEF